MKKLKYMWLLVFLSTFIIVYSMNIQVMADEYDTETELTEAEMVDDEEVNGCEDGKADEDITNDEIEENDLTEKEKYDSSEKMDTIYIIEDELTGEDQPSDKTYTITYKSNEGYIWGEEDRKQSTEEYAEGETISPPIVKWEGHAVIEWKSEKNGKSVYSLCGYLDTGGGLEWNELNTEDDYIVSGNDTFVAVWGEANTITFKLSEGSFTSYKNSKSIMMNYPKGKSIAYTPPVYRAGYALRGWKSEKTGTTFSEEDMHDYVPISDETFIAVWEEAYTITFKSEEGYINGDADNTEKSFYVEKGKVILDNFPWMYRPGYECTGWKSEKTGIIYSLDYVSNKSIANYKPNSDEIFIAVWEEAYTITFRSEEGYMYGYPEDYEQTWFVANGKTLDKVPSLNRPGYICTGWKSKKTGEIFSDESICYYVPTSDETFIAIWEEAYTVTFKSDEGYIYGDKNTKEESISVKKGNFFQGWIDCDGSASGLAFIGWVLEGTDKIYYSEFFNNYNQDTDYDGEHFFYKEDNGVWNYVPTGDVTFIAKWTRDIYKINYDANGGIITDKSSYIINKGRVIGYDYPAQYYGIDREGYVLTGYKVKETGEILSVSYDEPSDLHIQEYIPKSDITLIAQWEKAYKVTFKSEEGYLNGEADKKECIINVKKGSKISEIAGCNNYIGHVVTGFKLESNGKIYSPLSSGLAENSIWDYVPNSDVTFIVNWTDKIYNINIQDGNYYASYAIPKGSNLVYLDYYYFGHILPESKEKKAFKGYKIVGDASGKVYSLKGDATYDHGEFYKIIPDSNMTFAPVWEDAYYVSVDGDGGWHYVGKDGEYEKQNGRIWCSQFDINNCPVAKGSNLVIGDYYSWSIFDEGAMYKKGFDFVGWTVVGKEDKIYKFGEPIKVDSDMTIKALWKKKGEQTEIPGVSYRTHVQSFGWQDFVKDGKLSGTVGKSKRLEAIEIKLENAPYSGNIEYRTHVQSYGWQSWVKNGNLAGTSGQAKRLEAIQIRLTGEMAKHYDVYYRVQAQTYGWLGWAKNGEYSGTAGFAKRLEAIQIVLVEKGTAVNGSTKIKNITLDALGEITGSTKQTPGSAYVAKQPDIQYRTHVQSFGWQSFVSNGAMSGTSGKAKRLEGIEIKLGSLPYAGGVRYTTHVQTYGWQGKENDPTTWKKDGAMAGTSGEAKRLEAIRIGLYGEMAEKYDIYYRVHAQSYGWLGWAKNGEAAGTAGYAKRLEGIQIVLVEKGKSAPGKTYNGITANRNEAYISK